MAWGANVSAEVRFMASPTIDVVVDSLSAVEYKYNIAFVLENYRQGGGSDSLLRVAPLLEASRDAGLCATGRALRTFVEEGARLNLRHVMSRASFDFSFDGVPQAIQARS
jgi:hypothetical protein